MDNNVYHNFPKHDYALAILSQAAMHAPVPNAFTQENSQPSQITNQQTLHNQSHHNAHPHRGTVSGPSLGDYNHSASSSRNMETLTYGTQITRPDVYVPQTYPGMGSGQYSSHLGILNAEQYDDGRSMMRSHEASEMRLKQQQEAPMPFGITSGPQLGTSSEENDGGNMNTRRGKRMRAEMSTADEEDWAAKKARGRPRVDTKDETAADRRRTQIRMAQRAYRHRKETTISSLEKQVQELRGTNEEMSNTIISLYDFAIGKGMLQREPEFGQQLQSTIERILALAKASSSEDGTKDEEDQVEEEVKQDQIEASKPEINRRTKGRKRSPKVSPPEPPPPQLEAAPVNTWGGYEISKKDSMEEQVYQQQQQQQQQQAQAQERTRSGEHQIISLATEENASFPFDFMDLQQYRVELPSTEYYAQDFFSQATLPLPPTHAPQEYSFARRIQRAALEKAFTLITMQNPPQQRFQGVFGLCLLYESKDEVRARLQRCLSASSAKDPLQEWRAPFVHIGGAGTFYPKYESVEHMPKFRTGYSMGPQSPLVAAAEEKIQDPIRCKLPGFEGEFFDAGDVEGYLRGRGLEIPPNADFVTAQLDLRALGPRTKSSETTTTISSPDPATGHTVGIQGLLGLPNDQSSYTGELLNTGTNNTSYDHLANSACSLEFPLGFANWDESVFGKSNTNNIDPIFNRVSATQEAGMNSNDASTDSLYQHTITIDINTLMQELIGKAICLGRGPGFRPGDVNAAIITAIRAGAGA